MSEVVPELPPHAPETSHALRRLLGRFHLTGVFWFKFHYWGMRVIPSCLVWAVVVPFTLLFFVLLGRVRRSVGRNLEVVFARVIPGRRSHPLLRCWYALAVMWNFGWSLSERYERLATARPFKIDIDIERWRKIADAPHGFVLVTAHVGNYEVGSMLPAFKEGRQVHVVREREINVDTQRFIQDLLAKAGGPRYVSHFESDDPLHGVVLLESLRAGGIVGIQGDRPRHGGRILEATLFGQPFPLPAGPAALARLAEVPLVPIFSIRKGRRHYEIQIGDRIDVRRTGDRRGDAARAMRDVAAAIEETIARYPYQWFCFRSVFRGEDSKSGLG